MKYTYSTYIFNTPSRYHILFTEPTTGRDQIDKALAGDCTLLITNLADFSVWTLSPPKYNAEQWDEQLPSWPGRDKPRGLKEWCSNSNKGGWRIQGIQMRAVNKAIDAYMVIFAVPPVASRHPAMEDDMDVVSTFFFIVHRAYCKFLSPEVEEGTIAFQRVMEYMWTRRVRLKLLRAVRCQHTCSLHLFNTLHILHTCSIHNSIGFDTPSSWRKRC